MWVNVCVCREVGAGVEREVCFKKLAAVIEGARGLSLVRQGRAVACKAQVGFLC